MSSKEPGEETLVGKFESPPDHVVDAAAELRDADSGSGTHVSIGPISVQYLGSRATATAGQRRYTEERLEAGDTVHVYGPIGTAITGYR